MLEKAFSVSVEFLPRLVPKLSLRFTIQCLAFESDFLDLLMPVFENYCKNFIMGINVSLNLISTYTLSCIVFRESKKSSNFK